jgi:hypothetical protein
MSWQIFKMDFWTLWMEFLSGELLLDDLSQGHGESHMPLILLEDIDPAPPNQTTSLFEKLLSRYHPSRRLGRSFFNDHVLVSILSSPRLD